MFSRGTDSTGIPGNERLSTEPVALPRAVDTMRGDVRLHRGAYELTAVRADADFVPKLIYLISASRTLFGVPYHQRRADCSRHKTCSRSHQYVR